MKTTALRYTVIIRKEEKQYIADVPTLGISDFGRTIEEAKQHAQEAIACHIEGLTKTGNMVPPPDAEEFYLSQAKVTAPKNIQFAW